MALLLAKSAAGARWVSFCVWGVRPERVQLQQWKNQTLATSSAPRPWSGWSIRPTNA